MLRYGGGHRYNSDAHAKDDTTSKAGRKDDVCLLIRLYILDFIMAKRANCTVIRADKTSRSVSPALSSDAFLARQRQNASRKAR